MPGDREDEICQKALQLLAELCSVGAVENENCRDFIYYLRDRARPRLSDSGTAAALGGTGGLPAGPAAGGGRAPPSLPWAGAAWAGEACGQRGDAPGLRGFVGDASSLPPGSGLALEEMRSPSPRRVRQRRAGAQLCSASARPELPRPEPEPLPAGPGAPGAAPLLPRPSQSSG